VIDGHIYGAFNLAYGLGATGLFDMIFSSRSSVDFLFISGPNCGWRGMKQKHVMSLGIADLTHST